MRSWFKFNNLRLALDTNLKFYASAPKELKPTVGKFWGLISTFVEVTGEKLIRNTFLPPSAPILNSVNLKLFSLKVKWSVSVSIIAEKSRGVDFHKTCKDQ